MRRVSPTRGWPGLRGRHGQAGQALIYGMFVLIGGLAALFFLFNTGQLAREKTKLVNTTDAVAYSAGVMHARTLNFEAYTNRAMMANTVAIAQLVSLSSWVQYADNLGSYGFLLDNYYKWTAAAFEYEAASETGDWMQEQLNDSGALERLATTSDDLIRKGLMNAQLVAYAGLLPVRRQVMDEVAKANYREDGVVEIDLVPLTVNEFTSFVSRYSGDDRQRFADVAKVAVGRDSFLPKRSWDWIATYSDCATSMAFGRFDWLDRRGGTELIGLDEWKALDSLSAKIWVPESKWDVFCSVPAETPVAWGAVAAADNPSTDLDPRHYDYSLPINPSSTLIATATSDSWDYSGLPNFYELSDDALKQDDPRLKFAIRVRRAVGETVTSEGRSAVVGTPRLNAYRAQPAGGRELAAVSASEVFFEREGDVKDNTYGSEPKLNRPREIGSLFNPFWQVHLIQSDADIRKAQALQGAVLP